MQSEVCRGESREGEGGQGAYASAIIRDGDRFGAQELKATMTTIMGVKWVEYGDYPSED